MQKTAEQFLDRLRFEQRGKLEELPGSPDRDGTDVGFLFDEIVGVVIERNILCIILPFVVSYSNEIR
jgi:hypothetical protein